MKKILNWTILSLALSIIPFPTLAQQSNEECLMFDSSGNPIDLSYICENFNINRVNKSSKTRATSNPTTTGVFSVPITRREGGTPVIEVQFNNNHTFEMIVDTGATITVITNDMAQILNIQSEGTLTFQTASNNNINFDISHIDRVNAGGMTQQNLDVAISPNLQTGLLGQNFYGMYDLIIKHQTIEFRKR